MDSVSEKLTLMENNPQNHCFGCGPANATGIQLEFLLAEDGSVACLPIIPDRFDGQAGYLHGGIIATLLDEAMSKSVRARGLRAMTRQIVVEYIRPVPSRTPIRLEGRLVRSEGRKHWTEARILSDRDHLLAEAKGLFVELRSGHGSRGIFAGLERKNLRAARRLPVTAQ